MCRIRIGHSGPRLAAKFVSVYTSVEHGLCKTVMALKRDLGKRDLGKPKLLPLIAVEASA